jgi:hypothetical protein
LDKTQDPSGIFFDEFKSIFFVVCGEMWNQAMSEWERKEVWFDDLCSICFAHTTTATTTASNNNNNIKKHTRMYLRENRTCTHLLTSSYSSRNIHTFNDITFIFSSLLNNNNLFSYFKKNSKFHENVLIIFPL